MSDYDELLKLDPQLTAVVEATGRPDPFRWPEADRTGGDLFAAMVLHISSQQISTRVAFLLYDRLTSELGGGPPDAEGIVNIAPERWRALGFSHAKVNYLTALARRCLDGELDLAALKDRPDEQVRAELTALPGVGRWTTDLFLIFQLHRPDIFPAGDAGLRRAVGHWLPPAGTSVREVEARSEIWAPYRTYAASALWHSLSLI
jgi:DNA-3-methyladenine glycosylase II